MEITKDFREFLKSLNENGVKYLVVGGYAVNFHGYPRYTKDIDFWILPTSENIRQLLVALQDFGFDTLGLKVEDFADPNDVIQLGYEPYRIDLLTEIEGVNFEECYSSREVQELDGVKADFINLDELIKAKKTAGRLQDLADAEQLEKISKRKNKK